MWDPHRPHGSQCQALLLHETHSVESLQSRLGGGSLAKLLIIDLFPLGPVPVHATYGGRSNFLLDLIPILAIKACINRYMIKVKKALKVRF